MIISEKYSTAENTTLRRGVMGIQKVFKSIQTASDMKTARTVDFSTNSGYPPSGEGGI